MARDRQGTAKLLNRVARIDLHRPGLDEARPISGDIHDGLFRDPRSVGVPEPAVDEEGEEAREDSVWRRKALVEDRRLEL